MTDLKDKILLAEIYREHGLFGELKVFLYNPIGEGLRVNQTYFLKKTNGEMITTKLSSVRSQGKFLLVKFGEIKHRNQAESFRKAKIWIDREDLDLEEDEFLFNDLLDFEVFKKEGSKIGRLHHFEENPGHPLIVVKNQSEEYLIPFIDQWILEINWQEKKIILELPEGLLEVNQ